MIAVLAADRIGLLIVERLAARALVVPGTLTGRAHPGVPAEADAVVLATSRPRAAPVAAVAEVCTARALPLLVAVLDPVELRVGPVFERTGACYRCHWALPSGAAAELAARYDAQPDVAPSGHLPLHLGLAARTALHALVERCADCLVLRLADNAMHTVPAARPIECPHRNAGG